MASGSGLLDSKLPMRDLTGKYARFRNEYFLSSSGHSGLGHSRLNASPQPSSLSGPLLDTRPGLNEQDEHGLMGPTLRPEWADIHDQVEADMRQIKEAISTLRQLHRSRLNIHFDESAVSAQESEIEILTQSITTKLRRCEQGIKRIALVGDVAHLSAKERTVRKNSMIMLAQDLTSYSKQFRHAQKDFLKSLNEQAGKSSAFGFGGSGDDEALRAATDEAHLDEELTEEQRLQLDEINARSSEREKEVLRVARSVHELSTLFSELNVLVIEQGTVLDRIDYNIEQTLVQVKKGVVELEGAEKHSRRALTCKCILILLIIVIILIGILVYKKS